MANSLKKLFRFEDKTFWVDLTKRPLVCDIILSDGSRRPAVASTDVNFFELLKYGIVIGDTLPAG